MSVDDVTGKLHRDSRNVNECSPPKTLTLSGFRNNTSRSLQIPHQCSGLTASYGLTAACIHTKQEPCADLAKPCILISLLERVISVAWACSHLLQSSELLLVS